MTADGESTAKSCQSGESSLKRNSDHLDAGTSAETHSSVTDDPNSETDVAASDSAIPLVADSGGAAAVDQEEVIDFTVVFMKKKFEISLPSIRCVADLKQLLEQKAGVPVATQKLLFKGLPRHEMSLREWGLRSGSKVILMGTRLQDLIDVQAPELHKEDESKSEAGISGKPEQPLCRQKPHAKVIAKGKPDDALPAFMGRRERLPLEPLSGMTNKSGGKVRLTFKLESDQLWIGTKERTEKVSMTSIRAVVSEAIEGHEEYHMLAIQLGPTEASRYWIYWIPAQYVDAIRETILGA